MAQPFDYSRVGKAQPKKMVTKTSIGLVGNASRPPPPVHTFHPINSSALQTPLQKTQLHTQLVQEEIADIIKSEECLWLTESQVDELIDAGETKITLKTAKKELLIKVLPDTDGVSKIKEIKHGD